jgi:hypothetical protein
MGFDTDNAADGATISHAVRPHGAGLTGGVRRILIRRVIPDVDFAGDQRIVFLSSF